MKTGSDAAIDALRSRGLASLPPLAIVLGSGLGAFADEARDAIAISYLDIPGFPVPSVEGHAGRLVVGTIEGERVALFQGRGHYYERGDANAMRIAIDAFRKLGGETLLLTNAAGGLNQEWRPPALVAITDHINFSGTNPLIGHAGADRFVPLTEAYDAALLARRCDEAARGDGHRAQRGRLHVVFRAELRDAGRDPRRAHPRRRSRRHVDRAGGDPGASRRPALRRESRSSPIMPRASPAATRATRRRKRVAHEAADRFKRLLRGFIRAYRPRRHDPSAGNHPRASATAKRLSAGEIGDFIAALTSGAVTRRPGRPPSPWRFIFAACRSTSASR